MRHAAARRAMTIGHFVPELLSTQTMGNVMREALRSVLADRGYQGIRGTYERELVDAIVNQTIARAEKSVERGA